MDRGHSGVGSAVGHFERSGNALVPGVGIDVSDSGGRNDPAFGIDRLRSAGRGGRDRVGGIRERDRHPASGVQRAAAMDAVFPAGDCGVTDRSHRSAGCSAGHGSGVRIYRSGDARAVYLAISCDPGWAEDRGHVAVVCEWNSGRNVRADVIYRRDAGRGGGRGRAVHVSLFDDLAWDLCAGGDGSAVCRIFARPDDLGLHGAGSQRELFHHCAGDRREYIFLCDLARTAADSDL